MKGRLAHLFLAVALSGLLFLAGCVGMHRPVPGPGYLPYPTRAKGLDALKQISKDISHLNADARLRLTVGGKKQPGMRCRIYYVLRDGHEFIRASGLGPFGLILFDCLVTDREIFLYLPSRQVVYTAGTGDRLGNRLRMDKIIKVASLVLNPWLVAAVGPATQIPCQDIILPAQKAMVHRICGAVQEGCMCLNFHPFHGVGYAVFGKRSLDPLLLDTLDFDVIYHNDPARGGKIIPYPLGASIGFKDMALAIEIKFTRVSLDKAVAENELFDKRIFSSMPMRPLETLL